MDKIIILDENLRSRSVKILTPLSKKLTGSLADCLYNVHVVSRL